jgi:hypothetical protein
MPRTSFFDLPQFQRALRVLDEWGSVELGDHGQSVTARYALRTTRGSGTYVVGNVIGHAEVDTVLSRNKGAAVLRAFLAHRYPRCCDERGEISHRGSIDSFYHEGIDPIKRALGMKDWEVHELLRSREKEFVRDLDRHLKGVSYEVRQTAARGPLTDGVAISGEALQAPESRDGPLPVHGGEEGPAGAASAHRIIRGLAARWRPLREV